MLTFVGLGLWNLEDISLKGFKAVKGADEVYAELYTSRISASIEDMEKFFGRKIGLLERRDLEEDSLKLIERAREKDIAILVPGDPMVATTHSAIRLEAERRGVKTKIIHGASIVTAICGLTGLHNYRFGKSATVSWYLSKTPVDVINANRKTDAHTLLFLDLHPPMKIQDAIKKLSEVDENVENLFGVGVARAGSDDPVVRCDRLKKLCGHDFGDPPHVLVVLAETLHFMECESLVEFALAPAEIEKMVR